MWQSGYQSTLEGDAFSYASIAPDIRMALLIRGNKERPAVAWETAPITLRPGDDQVVLSSPEVPLSHLDGFNLERFRPVAEIEQPHVYSWVMNNDGASNFRTRQEGEFSRHYDLMSSVPGPPSSATRFGWSRRVPLVAWILPGSSEAPPGGRAGGGAIAGGAATDERSGAQPDTPFPDTLFPDTLLPGTLLPGTLFPGTLLANVLCVTIRPRTAGRSSSTCGRWTAFRPDWRSGHSPDIAPSGPRPLERPVELAPYGV